MADANFNTIDRDQANNLNPFIGSVFPVHSLGTEDQIINRALQILRRRLHKCGPVVRCTQDARDYLTLLLAARVHEVFMCLFLDAGNKVLAEEILSHGTLRNAHVYPREVIKRALYHNAAAVIFVHNHPSGETEPSLQDKMITAQLKNALQLIDVKTLDHLIVGAESVLSFAERGLLDDSRHQAEPPKRARGKKKVPVAAA